MPRILVAFSTPPLRARGPADAVRFRRFPICARGLLQAVSFAMWRAAPVCASVRANAVSCGGRTALRLSPEGTAPV
jgi:hypothetical protein